MARRHRTRQKGVFYVEGRDGARTYIATWKEDRSLRITDPLTTRRRTVERTAATFEEACHLRAEGVAADRQRRRSSPQSPAERLAERLMAAKWFEYWVRR